MFFNGTNHNHEGLELVSYIINLLLCLIITSVLVKNDVPLDSHVADIDRRDLARWDNMQHFLASWRSAGIHKVPLRDHLMMVSSGMIAVGPS